jgi:hypothetical protein
MDDSRILAIEHIALRALATMASETKNPQKFLDLQLAEACAAADRLTLPNHADDSKQSCIGASSSAGNAHKSQDCSTRASREEG